MAAAGKDVPALRNRPDTRAYGWLMNAFMHLNTCRAVGASPGRIPWTAVAAWSDVHHLNAGERWLLQEVIFAMDTAYLDYHQAKLK